MPDPNLNQNLWKQLSPEQQARIIAILVQMLLHLVTQAGEVWHEPASR